MLLLEKVSNILFGFVDCSELLFAGSQFLVARPSSGSNIEGGFHTENVTIWLVARLARLALLLKLIRGG